MLELTLEAEDFDIARQRQAHYRSVSEVAYAYNDPRAEARQSDDFSTEEYEQVTLVSLATEAAIARKLGVAIKIAEDEQSDLPGGVEVMARGPKHYHGGNPYLVERAGTFYPTLTVFLTPGSPEKVHARYLLTPPMVPDLEFRTAYAKSWGKTRHLVDSSSAVRAGGNRDVWGRLSELVTPPRPRWIPEPEEVA